MTWWRLVAFATAISLALWGSGGVSAAIIYVDDSATGANNGTSWANAYTDFQSALAVAQSGDEIRVGQGLYRPGPVNGPRESTFLIANGVNQQGGYGGVTEVNPDELDPQKHSTLLSGDLNMDDTVLPEHVDDNAYHVVTADGVNASTRLAGFTILAGRADVLESCGTFGVNDRGGGFIGRNGAQNLIEDCEFLANVAHCFGGGAFFAGPTAPTLRSCKFQFNRTLGVIGGQGAGAGLCSFAPTVVENCEFRENFDAEHGAGASAHSSTFRDCLFIDNAANESGGAISGTNLHAIRCTFIDNSAQGGGAVSAASATLVNCRFLNNAAGCGGPNGASGVNAGGDVHMVNCLFSGNQGGLGAVHLFGQDSTVDRAVVNCTFIANVGECFQGVAGGLNANFTRVRNCIFWDNAGFQVVRQDAQINLTAGTMHTTTVQGFDGSLGGFSNSGADPELVDPNGPDNLYGTLDDNPRLSAESPARDEGHNQFLPPDQHDLDGDGNTTELTPLDLDDLPRMVNGIVDRGAYEFQGAACIADITPDPGGDGTVNVDDLLSVISQYGDCPDDCTADLDNNGLVNVDDLLMIIEAWGSCPLA